jgi:hypothetical protein
MQFGTEVPTFRQKGAFTADRKVTGYSETVKPIQKITLHNILTQSETSLLLRTSKLVILKPFPVE